jgi:hypothetical protein
MMLLSSADPRDNCPFTWTIVPDLHWSHNAGGDMDNCANIFLT